MLCVFRRNNIVALKATCLCSANHVCDVCVLLVTGVGLGERLKNCFITTALVSVVNHLIPACIARVFLCNALGSCLMS